jgi:hypothetical protein
MTINEMQEQYDIIIERYCRDCSVTLRDEEYVYCNYCAWVGHYYT